MIDAHQHFWRIDRGDYSWMSPALGPIYRDFGPADLEPFRRRYGIERTVLVQAASTVAETDFMLDIAETTDWIAGVVGWVDFEDRAAANKDLARLKTRPKFKGVRPMIQDIPDPDWMLRSDVAWAYEALIDLDLTFDALLFPVHVSRFRALMRRHPRLRAIVDHGAKPAIRDRAFEAWAAEMAGLAAETDVFCKVSGLVTEAAPGWSVEDVRPYVDHLWSAFGPDRLVWGSDWPVVDLAGGFDAWRAATFAILAGRDGLDRVLGENAARFYRL